jgi:hypothetical protein
MSTPISTPTVLTAAAKAIGLAVVINSVLFFALFAFKIIDPRFAMGPNHDQTITIVPVVISTILFSIIGVVIFLLLLRFSSEPVKIFTWVVLAGFVLTLGNPFFAGIPTVMALGLDVLHIAPAYLLWSFLTKTIK